LQRFSAKRFARLLFLSLNIYFLGACSVPIGPGFLIQKQDLELRFVSSPEPHLAVRCTYQLINSGNRPLKSLRLLLPPAESFHRTATTAEWNSQSIGVQIVTAAAATDRADTMELHWNDPWTPKQKGTLILTYELSTGLHLGTYLAVSPDTFFAFPESWKPALLPPKNLFVVGGVSPKRWRLSVRVPSGFLVHASGTAGKRSTVGGEWIYSFDQRLRDFAPFAAGGKYVEREFRSDGERILFWTLQPVDPRAAQNVATSIASRAHYYETEYGDGGKGDRTIRLIECVIPVENFGCGALPETVFVDQAWIARGLKDKEFYDDVNFELAYTWFGGVARVRFEEYPLPMDALAPYAGWEAQAMEGGGARPSRIRCLLSDFDKRSASCKEKIILPLPAGALGCSYSPAWSKSGLLLFAIEDRIGRRSLHNSLKYMIQARRGQDVNLEDLIAALESETHQPQGEFVRKWLKHPGIPEDFRARYSMAVAPAVNSSPDSSPDSSKEPKP
jgi:hypothetical protein